MATEASAALILKCLANLKADSPVTGAVDGNLTVEQRWTDGTGSGQADRVFRKDYSLSSGGTQSFNLLAAGSLTDILGQAIDADEVKGLAVECVTGSITITGAASVPLGLFTASGAGVALTAGQFFAFGGGATGLSVGSNGSFDVDESTSAATASFRLWFAVAQ